LGALIEDLTSDSATVYIHNPTKLLTNYIDILSSQNKINLLNDNETYSIKCDTINFSKNIETIGQNIIGQKSAIDEVCKSMWYLTQVNRTKPYVIMLFGESSTGKTEMVREIAANFFGGMMLEKHLSMFKNEETFRIAYLLSHK
jgi:AAA+ superfamily predicted ATPase